MATWDGEFRRCIAKRLQPVLHVRLDAIDGASSVAGEQRMDVSRRKSIARRPASDDRAVAAPRPVQWMSTESGTDRIEGDVPERLEEMRPANDRDALETPLEEMAGDPVLSIRPLCERGRQELHAFRELRDARFDEQVEVVRHHAVREPPPFHPRGR